MPGLAVSLSKRPLGQEHHAEIAATLNKLRHGPNYRSLSLLETEYANISFTAYPDYPRLRLTIDNWDVFIEGAVYNLDQNSITHGIRPVLEQFDRRDMNSTQEPIARFLTDADGDFVVIAYRKADSAVLLFSDALGRLPLFYREDDNSLIIAREPKFISLNVADSTVDKLGLAQFLTFGYFLGDRSLHKKIKRTPPACFFAFNPADRSWQMGELKVWDFSGNKSSATFDKLVDDAREYLITATADRMRHRQSRPALALSGGLDSRAVLGAMLKSSRDIFIHTCNSPREAVNHDVSLAQQLASELQLKWTLFPQPDPSLTDFLRIVRHQEAGSSTVMALTIEHYRFVLDKVGQASALFTGDCAGHLKYPVTPPRKLRDLSDAAHFIIESSHCIAPATVERLCGVSAETVIQSLIALLEQYPESEPAAKYVHFRLLGRIYRHTLEAEDRIRFFIWSAAPLWHQSLFRLANDLPEEYKQDYRFITALLESLDPRLVQVPYAGVKFKVPFKWMPVYSKLDRFLKGRQWLLQPVRRVLLSGASKPETNRELTSHLLKSLDNIDTLPESFNPDATKEFLSEPDTRINFHLVATAVLSALDSENRYSKRFPADIPF